MIKVTYEFNNVEEAIAHLQTAIVPSPKAENPKPSKPKVTKAAVVSEAKPEEQAPAEKPVEYIDIKAAGLKLMQKHGREKLVEVLGKQGLGNAQEAKPEQYPDLLKALTDALA